MAYEKDGSSPQPELLTPSRFDEFYDVLWSNCMFPYIADFQSAAFIELYQVLLDRDDQHVAFLPHEAKQYITVNTGESGSLWEQGVAHVREQLMPSKTLAVLSNKMQAIVVEQGLRVNPIRNPLVLAPGIVTQLMDIQNGEDGVAIPVMMFIPENGYQSSRRMVERLVHSFGEVSEAMRGGNIGFMITRPDGREQSQVLQKQEFSGVEDFFIQLKKMFSTVEMREHVRGAGISMAEFVWDPEMVAFAGLEPHLVKRLAVEHGRRWMGSTVIADIYEPDVPRHNTYLEWQLSVRQGEAFTSIAQGLLPNFQRTRSGASDGEKRYLSNLCSVGQLTENKLLHEMEQNLAASIAGMLQAWEPIVSSDIVDKAYSEVLYSLVNSSWFIALSYAIAHKGRIDELLHTQIE